MSTRATNQWSTVFAVIAVAATSGVARAQGGVDRVHRTSGVDTGQISGVTALGVTISKSGVESTVAVENIESVYYAGEPAELNSVRSAIQSGRPNEALRILGEFDAAGITREEISAELEFYAALAKAQLALAGQGDLAAAIADLRTFMTRRRTSFHISQALEAVGDLLVADGRYGEARTEYAKLAKAPSAYFGLRSALLVGRAWQAEGKHDEALPEFDKALASAESGGLFDSLRLSATLDRAVSQSATGEVESAAATIGEIIAQADPEDGELLARAYAALGDCYLQTDDTQGALFAFLYVDLLYNNTADLHAKALHELVTLWREAGRESRSQEAAEELAAKYPESRWAKP
jgi:tetratricopeptide (TPR) repeat protein